MMRRGFVAVLALVFSAFAFAADHDSDALAWLQKMATAAKSLDYTGTFTYLSDQRFETMRIAHALRADGEVERLETLDGSPREVIRKDGEVRCILPGLKTVIIDREERRRAFPGRLPTAVSQLSEHYRIVSGDMGRVADRPAQIIRLEPLDKLRFGHHLWADVETGLLLKARMVDEQDKVVEQFVFNDIHIGAEVGPEALRARYQTGDDWHVVNAHGSDAVQADVHWSLSDVLPGYQLISTVKRTVAKGGADVLHMVCSDGLAHISVFIEPQAADEDDAAGFVAAGSIGVYARNHDGYRLTVLGEAPREALRRVGDGMVLKGD